MSGDSTRCECDTQIFFGLGSCHSCELPLRGALRIFRCAPGSGCHFFRMEPVAREIQSFNVTAR